MSFFVTAIRPVLLITGLIISFSLLSACSSARDSQTQDAHFRFLRAECHLYQVAYNRTLRLTGQAIAAIVDGCEGAVLAGRPGNFEGAGTFGRGRNAGPPASALRFGNAGRELWRRLIRRGVPPVVARSLTAHSSFAVAARAYAAVRGG